jgi:hypothetical protein
MKFLWCLIFLGASVHTGYAEACNTRRCAADDGSTEDRYTLESAKANLSTVVNRYLIGLLESEYGLTAAQVEDRLNKILDASRTNAGRPPVYAMDAFEAEVDFKLQLLVIADPRFDSGFPFDVKRALGIYSDEKTEALNQ